MAQKLTPQQRLERAAVWLMRQEQFIGYSGVIMVGDSTVEPDPTKCPTAYTDGFNVVYGEQFITNLTDEQLRFVILHENIHKMYMHTTVWHHLFKQNPMLANIAADYVVNGTILEAGNPDVHQPGGTLYDEELSHGKDVGEVWRLLQKECEENGGKLGKGRGSEGFDQHGWGEAEQWSTEQLQQAQEQIDSAIRQGVILAGRMGGDVNRGFDEMLKVKIDPWQILRKFLTDTCQGEGDLSYAKPNRRFLQYDMIMPTEICETLPHIVFGVDTSGSIQGDDLNYLLSNASHIFKVVDPEKVSLVYWDAAVANVESYERGQLELMVSSTKPAGGGGTDPTCVMKWLEKEKLRPTVLVMLTDGYFYNSSIPDPGVPVIWMVFQNDSFQPPYGQVVYI